VLSGGHSDLSSWLPSTPGQRSMIAVVVVVCATVVVVLLVVVAASVVVVAASVVVVEGQGVYSLGTQGGSVPFVPVVVVTCSLTTGDWSLLPDSALAVRIPTPPITPAIAAILAHTGIADPDNRSFLMDNSSLELTFFSSVSSLLRQRFLTFFYIVS
jgi:hypothetical protein